MGKFLPTPLVGLSCVFLLSCSSTFELNPTLQQPTVPHNWQNSAQVLKVEDNWLSHLNNPQALEFVQLALENNHQLIIDA